MSNIVGFIDLLATKESSRISQSKVGEAVKEFLGCLLVNQVRLEGCDYEIKCLSDSAFFQLPLSREAFDYLQGVRKDLFDRGIYFKCALVGGKLESAEIDAAFLSGMIAEKSMPASSGGKSVHDLARELAASFSGFYFSNSAIDAYELHEAFKGIGFILGDDVAEFGADRVVKSVYYLDTKLEKHVRFFDISFDNEMELGAGAPEEADAEQELPDLTQSGADEQFTSSVGWTYISTFLRSMQIATIKNKSYSRYYLPTLISMARSCSFTRVQLEEGKLVAAPAIYQKLVTHNHLGRMKPRPQGLNRVLMALLDKVLSDQRKGGAIPEEKMHLIQHVCAEFASLPGFVGAIHEGHSGLLTPQNRELFLEQVVG